MFDRTVVMSGENTKEYIPYAQTVTVNHAPTSEQAEYLEKLQEGTASILGRKPNNIYRKNKSNGLAQP